MELPARLIFSRSLDQSHDYGSRLIRVENLLSTFGLRKLCKGKIGILVAVDESVVEEDRPMTAQSATLCWDGTITVSFASSLRKISPELLPVL